MHRRGRIGGLAEITEVCMQALQTLAIGYLPSGFRDQYPQRPNLTEADMPLPEAMSRLSALSALTLHNVGWQYAPDGLPHLPNVSTMSARHGAPLISPLVGSLRVLAVCQRSAHCNGELQPAATRACSHAYEWADGTERLFRSAWFCASSSDGLCFALASHTIEIYIYALYKSAWSLSPAVLQLSTCRLHPTFFCCSCDACTSGASTVRQATGIRGCGTSSAA